MSLICFPVTLYTMFITFKKKFKVGEKNIYLEFTLYFIFMILIIYYLSNGLEHYMFFLSIPILLCFQYNKTNMSIILSMITILFYLFECKCTCIPILLISTFIVYYLIYYYYIKRTKSKLYITRYFVLNTVTFLIINRALNNMFNKELIIMIIIYIITCYLTTFLNNKISSLLITYKTLNDIDNDKDLIRNLCKISHEIKNPLIVIKGYLEIINKKDFIKSKRALSNEVDYALNILNDFKDLNHLKINKESFIINDIIKDLKYEIIPFYSDKYIKCRCICDSDLKIYADKKRIKQVLINIVKNSIESIDENGKINIHAYLKNKDIIIKIKDNGKGMDKDTLDNLFTPFYTKKDCGTGLGLCISKEIIKAHNGTIEYFSEINNYTEVKIVLPSNNKDSILDHNT